QLGLILQGSELFGLPAKADDMVDGLWDGVEGCLEEFRDPLFGLKCTQTIFEDFGLGAVSSWQQIEDNFEPFDIPDKKEWEKENVFPTDTPTPTPTWTPKSEPKCLPGE